MLNYKNNQSVTGFKASKNSPDADQEVASVNVV